jgi:mannose-1-phosphate guanylyltransferase/mannose-6-phosphate isomerase
MRRFARSLISLNAAVQHTDPHDGVSAMATIYPVIMAGGSGTRLWPLSRKATPKQYQRLLSERTMLEDTVTRLYGDAALDVAAPTVVCAAIHAQTVEDQLRDTGHPARSVILEPVGRNTAPVAIVAALDIAAEDAEGLILLLPADHHIADAAAFRRALSEAAPIAADGYLTTFGIAPDRPETGYGYIRRGARLADAAHTVEAFVEKPDLHTAQGYLAEGDYAWNAGIFLFAARDLLAEAERHATDIHAATLRAFGAAKREGHRVVLPEGLFAEVPADSIDYAIMERTERAAVIGPVHMGWNDIGAWDAVRGQSADPARNADRVLAIDCAETFVWSDGPLVAAIGVEDLVIVATGDAVLVTRADRAQEVKAVVDELKRRGRTDLL